MPVANWITKNRMKHKAFSLIEILLAIFLFTLFSVTVVYLSIDTASRATQVEVKNEALLYAEEGLEAVRNIRDRDYLDLASGTHGLSFANDTWTLGTAPETIDVYYQRSVLIEDVYRDGNGDIATTGTLDLETKKVTATVTWDWKGVLPKTISLSTYLSNWTGDEWMQTTCTEFNVGSFTDTESEASVSPPADNCALELLYTEGQSPFFSSVDVGSHGTDVVVDGDYVYLTTGKSQEGLVIGDVSDPSDPQVIDKLDIGGKGRYLLKSGDYLYIGVDNSSLGLAVVDVSNPSNASLVRQVNIGGNGNQAVVSETTLFIGVEKSSNSFVVYSIATPETPSLLGSFNTDSATNVVHLSGSYAYIGIDNSGSSLRVVNISNPAAMTSVGSLDIGGKILALELNSAVLYAGTDDSDDSFHVINVSNPASPSAVSSMDVGAIIKDMKVQDAYLYAPMEATNNALAVFNVSSPLSPVIAFFADISGKGTGVDTTEDNVYISIDTNNQGLVLVETVNVELASPGSYTSDIFDTGSTDTRYNFIEWEATVPLTGSVDFKIRTASSMAGLDSATWVGSDGTSSTSYNISPSVIVLDPLRSGNRYAQVQVTMTSDGVSTPSLESFSLNYNP